MITAGITGGIGSGKTSACRIFEALGVPVYYADEQAKLLMNTDPELKTSMEECFGRGIYENGTLNRRKLADIIFNDKTALEKVNARVHPAVARDFRQWCLRQTVPYMLEESAILFENNMARRFGKIILVTAPEAVRIQRVRERDQITEEAIRARIKNQWPDEKKIPLADYVIYNDELHLMIPQVLDIHQQLLRAAKKTSNGIDIV